jgi:(1->4)-alpha-D-glucan 1-alpha-D-glucosylmutase
VSGGPGETTARPSGPEVRATYRLQLSGDFGFDAAGALIPYLRDLGISHLYLSPCFQAREGSEHGYDVVDPRRLSDALGGEPAFRCLADRAHAAGLGLVLDVVPNHMAADDANPFWADPVLRGRFFDIDPVTGRHRRFFDIDHLAGVRQEDELVFTATHELVLRLVREGVIDGLRIDHVDGLADPAGYLQRLHARGAKRVWVEKILAPEEALRQWPVCGTVGYDFLNDACALFVDPAGEERLTSLWREVSGDPRSFGEVALDAKLEQVRGTFAPEAERLAREDGALAAGTLERGLASLPVYRTYVDAVRGAVAEEDRRAVAAASMAPQLAGLMLLERAAAPAFVTRFQQTTPAVTAKGVEDTALYRYGRLLALNEVGGDPGRFGIGVGRFHADCLERARRFPMALLTTQTHDAKRSADVRARLGALAAFAQEWASVVERWFERTEPLRWGGAPDDMERYFLFQTVVGAWPLEPGRIESYMRKALREAKRNTNWLSPNEEWEEAVARFCRSMLSDRRLISELERFIALLAPAAERAVLGQVALKLTSPGIPDIYQGDELPYRALVDPDNRRPVDWARRRRALRRLEAGSGPVDETRKLFMIRQLLALRARRPEVFTGGAYEPLAAGEGLCAFVRGGEVLVAVVVRSGREEDRTGRRAPGSPRRPALELEQPRGRWRNVLTGEEHAFAARQPLARVLGPHGIGVFERVGKSS